MRSLWIVVKNVDSASQTRLFGFFVESKIPRARLAMLMEEVCHICRAIVEVSGTKGVVR